nr:PREDICTED: G-protein coupled receptor 12-like [Anolis carolinensis]|eukprot:XP_008121971.1 PREDICTED: G-protein coupled receptor 12-like [Anolis carolinensis]
MLQANPVAMEEQLREQQHHLLVLLNAASSRPFSTLWPPGNTSAAATGSPSDLSPATAATAAATVGSEDGAGSGGGSGGGGSGMGSGGGSGAGSGAGGSGGDVSAVAVAVNPWDVALCATGTAVACENALVLAVLFYSPNLRAPMFLLIGSLALADLLAGVGLVVNFSVQYLLQPSSQAATLGAAALLLTAFSASAGSLLAITVDRYLSLYNALTYHSERTRAFTATCLLCLWLLCLALGLLPLLGWNCFRHPTCSVLRPVTKDNAALLAAAFLLLFALMLQLYSRICKVACRHAQQIAVQHQFTSASASSCPGAPASPSGRKGVTTLSLVLGTFALCWMPLAIYALVADATYPPVYTYALALPAACNSLLNPVIYAFRNGDIQKSLWLACCGCIPARFSSRPRTSSDV